MGFPLAFRTPGVYTPEHDVGCGPHWEGPSLWVGERRTAEGYWMVLQTRIGRVLRTVLMAALATSALAGGKPRPPVVTITSPDDGRTFLVGTEITFTATAIDKEDGNISQSIQWTCDQVKFGVGATFTETLAEGSHVITASAIDSSGEPGTDSIAITVKVLPPYRIPDLELLDDTEFMKLWGEDGSKIESRTAEPGGGVTYEITLATTNDGKIGIGDRWNDWGMGVYLDLDWDPELGHATSLAAYRCYEMQVHYLGVPDGSKIQVCLYLNTGLTGPSGFPSNEPDNDTYWQCDWVTIEKGGKATLQVDFNDALADHISDNPVPHTGGGLGWYDGFSYQINDRDRHELSNIGLQVIDGGGSPSTLGKTITIGLNLPGDPKAEFTASPTSGPAPLTVNFTDQSTACTSWSWDFGDGNTSVEQNPTHTYAAAGTYDVSLTVDGPQGPASVTKTAYITATDVVPVHVFSVDVVIREVAVNTFAEAAVIVVDGTGDPVEGATVTVAWSDAVTGTATGVTDATGLAVVASPKIKTRKIVSPTTFTASVTNVTKAGTVYDPAANEMESDSETVP